MINPDQFHGMGVDHMFPESGSPVRSAPFPRAPRQKANKDYDKSRVTDALRNPPRPVNLDPRTFMATQPSVTEPGVRHYEGGEWKATGELYADHDSPGNRYPVVYDRFNAGGDKVDRLLLSGHHRASADLAAGRETPVIHIEGPHGGPRNKK